jgi:transposase
MPLGPALYVGTDISEAMNRTRFLDPGETEVGRGFSSANDLPGSEQLAGETLRRAREVGATEIRWGLEATNLFWWHLATYLTTHPDLLAAGLKVWVFNPRQAAGFKDAYGDLGKGDWVDALVIADRLRFGRLPAECYLDERYQPLQRLTRHRRHLVKTLVREKQVALGYVYLKLSAYHLTKPLADTFGATSQVLLTDYLTPDEIVAAPLEELAGVIARESRGKVADPGEVAETVKQAARRSYRLPARMVEPVNLVLSSSLATIRALSAQLKPMDKVIAAELEAVPRQTVDTVPGLGPVFTAGIVAELGDVRRFDDEESVAKFAGLTWRRHQSGEFEGEDRPLTKTGNVYLRYYLVEGANSVRLKCPEFRSYYERKFAEATRHQHRRALVLTARKLVRLVDSLLRSGQIYLPPGAGKAP